MKRPEGSNADEWAAFLECWLDCQWVNHMIPFLAVQIAEAIDDQAKRSEEHHHAQMEILERDDRS